MNFVCSIDLQSPRSYAILNHILLLSDWFTVDSTLDNGRLNARYRNISGENYEIRISKPGVIFIDPRPGDLFRGEKDLWVRNGHIPSARNIPWPVIAIGPVLIIDSSRFQQKS